MDMPRDGEPTFNQMKHVGSEERFERACLELIGDFATYEPQGTTILVEGGSKFDQEVVLRLFATELRGVNVASVAGKGEVVKKKKKLWGLQDIQDVRKEVVTITDGDGASTEKRAEEERLGEFRWGLYDIESYLLDAKYISLAVGEITMRRAGEIPMKSVESLMRSCAQQVKQELVNKQLVDYVRRKLTSEVSRIVRRPEHSGRITKNDISKLVIASREAATEINSAAQAITEEELENYLTTLIEGEDSGELWESEKWKQVVPGKRVLQKVAETLSGAGSSVQVRNVIIGLMARDGYKPAGMLETIERALAYRREAAGPRD